MPIGLNETRCIFFRIPMPVRMEKIETCVSWCIVCVPFFFLSFAMYQIANLVSETFPETARIFYGLSKSEFVTEPELVHLAVKNGLLKAAVVKRHMARVKEMLRDKRLTTDDLANAFSLALHNKDFAMIHLLSADDRFDPTRYRVGKYEASVARWFLQNPRFPPPKQNDVIRAAFGPHGGGMHDGHILWNDLSTLKAVLSDARLDLGDKFCRDLCETVCAILVDNSWETEGSPCPLPFFKKHLNYVCFTNMRRLAWILLFHPRFYHLSGDLEEVYWNH